MKLCESFGETVEESFFVEYIRVREYIGQEVCLSSF